MVIGVDVVEEMDEVEDVGDEAGVLVLITRVDVEIVDIDVLDKIMFGGPECEVLLDDRSLVVGELVEVVDILSKPFTDDFDEGSTDVGSDVGTTA